MWRKQQDGKKIIAKESSGKSRSLCADTLFHSVYGFCRVFIMMVKAEFIITKAVVLMWVWGVRACSKPDSAMRKEITEQYTNEDS